MFKSVAKADFEVNNRQYTFICPPDAPFEDIKSVHFEIGKIIAQAEDYHKAQLEAQRAFAESQRASEEAAKASQETNVVPMTEESKSEIEPTAI